MPQIAPDGNIVLDLLVTKNSVLPSTGKTSQGQDLPHSIVTREIVNKIMTKDGETIVIVGIYDKVDS